MTDGQEIIMEITAMAHDGRGIGRHGGMVVFVPGAVLGDTVRCRVIRRERCV